MVTQGCDGSVLLDDTSNFTGEKNAGPNRNSIRGFEFIDAIKSQIEYHCPSTVSCADLLALLAREAVNLVRYTPPPQIQLVIKNQHWPPKKCTINQGSKELFGSETQLEFLAYEKC